MNKGVMKQQQKPLDEQDESNIHIENFAVPFLKFSHSICSGELNFFWSFMLFLRSSDLDLVTTLS